MTNNEPTEPNPKDLTLSKLDRGELIGWAAECARRLLPVFELHRPADSRLVRALDATTKFREGMLRVGRMREEAFSCHAAARACTDPRATAVARACGQALAVAHMGGHARNLPRYTRKALSGQVLADELEHQRALLPLRFHHYIYGQ